MVGEQECGLHTWNRAQLECDLAHLMKQGSGSFVCPLGMYTAFSVYGEDLGQYIYSVGYCCGLNCVPLKIHTLNP